MVPRETEAPWKTLYHWLLKGLTFVVRRLSSVGVPDCRSLSLGSLLPMDGPTAASGPRGMPDTEAGGPRRGTGRIRRKCEELSNGWNPGSLFTMFYG